MKNATPWTLVRAGKVEQRQGLQQLQIAHDRDRNASTIMELGVAYLWLYQYQQAWEHFREAIETFQIKGDGFYGMAGVAKWCLGQPGEAVSQWRAGLEAKYARASGLGVTMPLLLFFASVVKSDVSEQSSARKLLLQKANDARINYWPGPLVKLVLDQINQSEFQRHCRAESPKVARDREWVTEFYKSVMCFEQVGKSTFQKSMGKLANTTQPEWQQEEVLLTRIWSEEFFLARHEATSGPK